ncbi:hypothetical protein FRC17_004718 [Serendipita sp. 399]|nr:hypothetical protein FRC17_004718 [Serendipita sp. 399]
MAPTTSLAAVIAFSGLLACAVYTIPIHFDKSGGARLLESTCPPTRVKEYAASYGTGIEPIDGFLCGIDTFFKTASQPPIADFMRIFLLNGPVAYLVLLLESSRDDRPYVAYVPLLFGFLTQTITAALSSALFWALFTIQACFGGSRQAKTPVSHTAVEASVLAVLLGYGIPTAWMMVAESSFTILAWQPFPVYMSIIYNGWLFYRSKAPRQSGWNLVQLSLLFFSGVASVSWVYILFPYFSKNALWDLYRWLPSWDVPSPETTTLTSALFQLLQYDFIWMFAATILAALFLSQEWSDLFFAVQTLPLLIVAFGPGAVVGGLWLFREMQLIIQEEQKKRAAEVKRR